MQRRCDRNRKRSKRRAIYCPVHGCYLESVSQKHKVFVDQAGQLQKRGVGRRDALMTIASRSTVVLDDEWLEAFWCDHCQTSQWYYVKKMGEREYQVTVAPPELWQQVLGVIDPKGNPSVSEFTRTQARMLGYQGMKAFNFTR